MGSDLSPPKTPPPNAPGIVLNDMQTPPTSREPVQGTNENKPLFKSLDASVNNSVKFPGEPPAPHPTRTPQSSPIVKTPKRLVDGEHGQLVLDTRVSSDDTRAGMLKSIGKESRTRNDDEILDTIHVLRCIEGSKDDKPKSRVNRYQLEPFEGIPKETDEPRKPYAIMDVVTAVWGNWPEGTRRVNQQRETFLDPESDRNKKPFRLGQDFITHVRSPPSLRILSPRIIEILRKLVEYYPDHSLSDKEVMFEHPYRVLVHHYAKLLRIKDSYRAGTSSRPKMEGISEDIHCDEELQHQLGVLLRFLDDNYYQEEVKPELSLYKSGHASYEKLWILLQPGEIVFAKVRGEVAGFVVSRVKHKFGHQSSTPSPFDHWEVSVWSLAYTGELLTRQANEFGIYRYEGTKAIPSLEVFPVEYLEDSGKMRQKLINRGKDYHSIVCRLPAHKRYSGDVIEDKPDNYTGEIIIDPAGYVLYAPQKTNLAKTLISKFERQKLWRSANKNESLIERFGNFYTTFTAPTDLDGGTKWTKFNAMDCSPDTKLEEAQYLLLPGHVLGFALGRKEWMVFDMNYVKDIYLEKNPMKHLQLEDETKELVLAMSNVHKGEGIKPWAADFIKGKGEGRVILLHGAPGTGKTMTVECIAKHTKRPLLSLSVADLGTKEVDMERRLKQWLARAHAWGAIVMIDEAEIYLEERVPSDLSRNALVTAFLRIIEYYPGMLFLTTNRPGHIDEAIRSRIHVSVEYLKPNKERRNKIWESLFEKLEEDQEGLELSPRIIITPSAQSLATAKGDNEFKDFLMNGRDIRNALLNAISVAQRETEKELSSGEKLKKVTVREDHIRKVLLNKKGFEESFVRTHGKTSEEAAAANFDRPYGAEVPETH